jgi:ABC-type nitrate/sulfonate/bicarbonate transport system permease component
MTAQQTYRTTEMFAGIIVIAVLGLVLDRILRVLRRKVSPWYVELSVE